MKIVVLGGAGDMGSRAVEDLSTSPGVKEVTIADQNVPRARALADRLGDAPARINVTAVDANVKDSLVAVMRGHDVAASALGPFYRYETKLVSAALEADIDYASICDEPEPTQKVFDKFSSEARDQGRTVLVGLGTSPGATNLAFAHLAAGMETVRRADIFCYQPLDGGGGRALLHHALHIINGRSLAWRRGRRSRIAALSEESTIPFPRFGAMRVWNMGHAEPLTIPRYHPEIRDVNFMMGFGLGSSLLVHSARLGAFATPSRIDAAVAVIAWVERWMTRKTAHGAIRVEVEGSVDGKPLRKMLCGTGKLREVTGNVLSIGAQMVARREITPTTGGVFAPEGCMRTDRAFAEFARRGMQFFEDLEMTQPLLPAA